MKIVHIVEPFAAGVATFIRQNIECLPYDQHIIIHGERKEYNDVENVKNTFPKHNVRFIRWANIAREIHPLHDLRALFALIMVLKRFKDADAIHLHSSKAGFLGRIACNLLGIKNVIYTPNGLSFLMVNKKWTNRMVYLAIEWMATLLNGKIIAASPSEQAALKKLRLNAGCIANGTQIYPLEGGVAMPKNASVRDKIFTIVTVGRIEEQKGPAYFYNIAKYFEQNPNIRFVWVGDGPDRHMLSSKNIFVTGWKKRDEVADFVREADLYLSTAQWEGLPFAVLEAMSLGKNLLLSKCVGNEDLVEEGKNGMLFQKPSEAVELIKLFYQHPFLVNLMGYQSHLICRDKFDAKNTALQYRMEYAKLRSNEIPETQPFNRRILGERIYLHTDLGKR